MQNKNISIKILKRIPVFAELTDGYLEDISGMISLRTYNYGDMVIKEGDSGNDMFILLKGEVRISKFVNGQEEAIMVLKPGSLFGEMCLLGETTRTASVIANSEISLYSIDGNQMTAYLDKNTDAGYKVMRYFSRTLSKRLKALNERYHSILSMAAHW